MSAIPAPSLSYSGAASIRVHSHTHAGARDRVICPAHARASNRSPPLSEAVPETEVRGGGVLLVQPRAIHAVFKPATQEKSAVPPALNIRRHLAHGAGKGGHAESGNSFALGFVAEENDNELAALTPGDTRVAPPGKKPETRTRKPMGRPRSPDAPEEFDREMNRHGLLDKIVHIQQLKNYFELEIGGPLPSPQANSGQRSPDNVQNGDKSYAFPFQKRARSNSPPKNGALFGSKRNSRDESPTDIRMRKPVVARTNFVMGKALQRKQESEFMKMLENEELMDCGGLSTGPTDEAQQQQKAQGGLEEEWMYQRIGSGNGEDKAELEGEENVPAGEGEIGLTAAAGAGGSFLKVLNSVHFNS